MGCASIARAAMGTNVEVVEEESHDGDESGGGGDDDDEVDEHKRLLR